MTDVEPTPTGPKFEPASVVTEFSQAGNLDHTTDLPKIVFTWDDIQQLATAMNIQGAWFLGHDVRTPEQAWVVARDLLIAMNLMGYDTKPVATVLTPPDDNHFVANVLQESAPRGVVPRVTAGVTGQAGNSR